MNQTLQKVRMDKWLWSVRIFKSRTIASDACKMNKVRLNGHPAKPSDDVRVGDVLQVKKEGFNLVFKVVQLIEKRVSAVLAEPCYQNITPEEELNKFKTWNLHATVEVREKGSGRPTKKERRALDEFKGIGWDEDEDFE
jgi:ribosome-associated heat shock protein Hsp15